MGIITSIQSGKEVHASTRFQKPLLYFGIVSIAWYLAINIIIPLQYAGYNIASRTVSELSAIDSPTRSMWIAFCIPFSIFTMAFGLGIWLSAKNNKNLRAAAVVIIFDAVFGLFWAPMHQRPVIAAGDGTLSDILHIVWTVIHLILMLLMIWFGAAAFKKGFRIYSIATVLVFMVFGILTMIESKGISAGEATPYIGIWERINMGAYMLWVIVFAIVLLRRETIMRQSGI